MNAEAVLGMTMTDFEHTIRELRQEVKRLAVTSYQKEYEIRRLRNELRVSCGLIEV